VKPNQPEVRVTGRRTPPAEPELSAEQRVALARIEAGGPVAVFGAPGTGKTVVAVAAATRGIAETGDGAESGVVLLSPTRQAAAALRDRVDAAARATASGASAMTPMALAYAILRRAAVARGESAPVMITGPEQDAILADLLAGHTRGEGRAVPWPASIPPAARGLRALRHEVRDLMMRGAERDIGPAELDALGRDHGVPEWRGVAHLYQEYLDVQALRGTVASAGMRYDAAALISSASQVLREDGSWEPPWRRVLVDDYHEATTATRAMLYELAARGAQIVVLGCPDIAVQTYRGARPGLLAQAVDPRPAGLGAEPVVLATNWRQAGALREATAGIAAHIRPGRMGMLARHADRPLGTSPAGGAPVAGRPARSVVLPSAAEEAAYIAHTLRSAHLLQGMAWSAMAVLTRSSAGVRLLRSALSGAQVPLDVPGMEVPVRSEPAARPLLHLLTLVSDPAAELVAADVCDLLLSSIGGMDAMSLRQLRRALRTQEHASGGGRTSDDLLLAAIERGAELHTIPSRLRAPVERMGRILAAGRGAASDQGADAELVLWALWDATGLASTWQSIAIAGGAGSSRADRDLDAIMALMDAAKRYAERRPGASPASFAEAMASQDVPADTLAARVDDDRVTLATAASAMGREWDLVVVAGVQEGIWPDLRLRDTVLGASRLADLVDGRGVERDWVEQRRATLDDELRSFALACSRARSRLIVTAVQSEDQRPSDFMALTGVDVERDQDGHPLLTRAPLPLDLRGLVARLRTSAATDDDAARLLAALAVHQVAGADPAWWAGLVPDTSTEPLVEAGATVVLTPSRVEALVTCPLRWALDGVGGHRPAGLEQTLGSLVHAIAETVPSSDPAVLIAAFDTQWQSLGLPDTWINRRAFTKGHAMIAALAAYNEARAAPLAVEAGFEVTCEGVVLRGTIDRIDAASSVDPSPSGEVTDVRIVDFKTGAGVLTAAQAGQNPQLGVYQVAVNAGGLDAAVGLPLRSQGADLVYLARQTTSGPAVRHQPPVDGDNDWVHPLLSACAAAAASATFTATPGPTCRHCPVATSCPANSLGEQVTM
jgi:superfamily I DNA/RNA helicase/RecB family exonuclease